MHKHAADVRPILTTEVLSANTLHWLSPPELPMDC